MVRGPVEIGPDGLRRIKVFPVLPQPGKHLLDQIAGGFRAVYPEPEEPHERVVIAIVEGLKRLHIIHANPFDQFRIGGVGRNIGHGHVRREMFHEVESGQHNAQGKDV